MGRLRAVRAERAAEREEILSSWDFGHRLCEGGDVAHGLLVIAETLQSVPANEALDAELRSSLSLELDFWHPHCDTLQREFPHPDEVLSIAVLPDGSGFCSGCADGVVRHLQIDGSRVRELASLGSGVNAVSVSPDATKVIAGSAAGEILIADLNENEPPVRFPGHKGGVHCVAVSPDGKFLLTGGEDHECTIRELETGRPLRSLSCGFPVMTVCFDDDGGLFHVGGGRHRSGESCVYETNLDESAVALFTAAFKMPVLSAAFGGDSDLLVVGDANWETTYFRMPTGEKLASTDFANGNIKGLTISKDGTLLLSAVADSRLAMSWNLVSLTDLLDEQAAGHLVLSEHDTPDSLFRALPHPAPLTAANFLDHGGEQFLTACRDGYIRLWKRGLGSNTRKLVPADKSPVGSDLLLKAVAIDPSGRRAFTACEDGRVRIWDVSTGIPAGNVLSCGAPVLFVGVTADGSKVVTADDGDLIRLWDTQTGREIQPAANFAPGISGMSLNVDHNLMFVGGSGVAQKWSMNPLKATSELIVHSRAGSEDWVVTAISPNAERLLTGGQDGFARLWDFSGRLIAELSHQNGIHDVAFSPDNRWSATASEDRTAKIWNACTGGHAMTLTHDSEVFAVKFLTDQLLLTGSRTGTQLWDFTVGRRIGPLCSTGEITMSLGISRDRTTVIMGDWDGIGMIWTLPQPLGRNPEELLHSI